MQFSVFKEQLQSFTIFSLNDARKIDPDFHRARLNDWQDKGYIKKIRRGYYIFSDLNLNEGTLFLMANGLYSPSYVSLESALSFHGLIPEGVYSITSVTTRKTASFQTPVANFAYRSIKRRLNFGYRLMAANGRMFKLAGPEKAVLDYLYLNPDIVREADYEEWRFDAARFLEIADVALFRDYAAAYGHKTFLKRAEALLAMIRHHQN
jgi:predicted transcriptional regulator of viral defense system